MSTYLQKIQDLADSLGISLYIGLDGKATQNNVTGQGKEIRSDPRLKAASHGMARADEETGQG